MKISLIDESYTLQTPLTQVNSKNIFPEIIHINFTATNL